jgi:putative spermidine/putrescine transport system permease protein
MLFGGGLVVTVLQSLGHFTPVDGPFTGFAAYRYLLSQSWFLNSFAYSLYVAGASAILSVVLGVILAYAIWRSNTPKFSILYKLPLIMPHITVAFLTVLFFSDAGLIASVSHALSRNPVGRVTPSFLYNGNGFGLIAAYVYKETSFAAILFLGVLVRIDARLLPTAKNLGASQWLIFRRIVFPYLIPVINTTFIILFLYSFGAFDIPFLLSESRPQMLSIFVYSTYFKSELLYRPVATAALVCMLVVSLVFLVIYNRIARLIADQVRKL